MGILVTGCPRSGTSLVAGTLHKSGIWMGDTFPPPGEFNPTGYFEHQPITDINDYILKLSGGSVTIFPRQVLDLSMFDQLRTRIKQHVSKANGGLWGIKDPRIIPLWSLYRDMGYRWRIILCQRNRYDTIVSVERAIFGIGALSVPSAVDGYVRRQETVAADVFPVLRVMFEDWWADRAGQLARLSEFVGVELDGSHFDARLWRSKVVDKSQYF